MAIRGIVCVVHVWTMSISTMPDGMCCSAEVARDRPAPRIDHAAPAQRPVANLAGCRVALTGSAERRDHGEEIVMSAAILGVSIGTSLWLFWIAVWSGGRHRSMASA